MAEIVAIRTQTLYLAPTKKRRYLTPISAAYAEARAMLNRKYPKEDAEYEHGHMTYSGWHWSSDPKLVLAHARLARIILKRFRANTTGRQQGGAA